MMNASWTRSFSATPLSVSTSRAAPAMSRRALVTSLVLLSCAWARACVAERFAVALSSWRWAAVTMSCALRTVKKALAAE
jgi:hypothetical protein